MKQKTISCMLGKGNLRHNSRKFYTCNVNPELTRNNICYCDSNIRAVYHELFDEAVEEYNSRQSRDDRKIEDYYKKICHGRQEKPFYEAIFQIGNMNDTAVGTEDGETASRVLDEFARTFQKRNPHLRLIQAYQHKDESVPHLHLCFIPVARESKRGLKTRVSLKQALKQQGFVGVSRQETEWSRWIESERRCLSEIMVKHGFTWMSKGTHKPHLSVLDYKVQQRQEELRVLEERGETLRVENSKRMGEAALLEMRAADLVDEISELMAIANDEDMHRAVQAVDVWIDDVQTLLNEHDDVMSELEEATQDPMRDSEIPGIIQNVIFMWRRIQEAICGLLFKIWNVMTGLARYETLSENPQARSAISRLSDRLSHAATRVNDAADGIPKNVIGLKNKEF